MRETWDLASSSSYCSLFTLVCTSTAQRHAAARLPGSSESSCECRRLGWLMVYLIGARKKQRCRPQCRRGRERCSDGKRWCREIISALGSALDARRQRIIVSQAEVNAVKWWCLYLRGRSGRAACDPARKIARGPEC